MNLSCHICSGKLRILGAYSNLMRVTSDCKPWPKTGKMAFCTDCATAQAVIDEEWHLDCARIYSDYSIYYQSGGREQHVFDLGSGVSTARSDKLISEIAYHTSLPQKGKLLDFGCGNGAFLSSFSSHFPSWEISGSEYSDKYKAEVQLIPNFKTLYTGDPSSLPDGFDAISLIHVLEHIATPHFLLKTLGEKLREGGLLLIQLPYYIENPFVLPIADHATHFDLRSIRRLLVSCGFEPIYLTSSWVSKELSVIAQRSSTHSKQLLAAVDPSPSLQWLYSVRNEASCIANTSSCFGVFGTSIAANWLFSELGDQIQFYVDEDPQRVGKVMNGARVLSPEEVDSKSTVFIALPPKIAANVYKRLTRRSGVYRFVGSFD